MPEFETPLIAEVYDQLQQAMAADRAGFTELYRDYLADAWQTLQRLRDAVRQRLREETCARAHYLKSSSLVLGAHRVARHATMLEETARTSDIDEDALGRIADALREVQAELAVRLGGEVLPAGRTAA
jgi:Hpt domain-containing protein